MGYGQFLNQEGFGGAYGAVSGVEGPEKFVETVLIFGVKDDGAGKDAVMEGVPAGDHPATGCDRSA
jgi:hypothetical protein